MSAITFELLKDADPSDLDMYRRILNGAFPEGLEPWTPEMGEVLHLISALPIGTATGRLPGFCHLWVTGGENGRRVEEWELVAVGGRWILFKRNQGRFTISYVPLHGFDNFQRAMKTGDAVFEAAIKQPEPEEDRLNALEKRVSAVNKELSDRITVEVHRLENWLGDLGGRLRAAESENAWLKVRVNSLLEAGAPRVPYPASDAHAGLPPAPVPPPPAAPWDFPASDVRAGMAPAAEPPIWAEIKAWSKATFGPGRRTKGLLEHIRRELDEVAAAPDDLVEWVDVVLLAFDGYWRHGGTPEGFLDMVRYKFKVNQARKWPPPAPDDQPNHHVKDPPPAAPTPGVPFVPFVPGVPACGHGGAGEPPPPAAPSFTPDAGTSAAAKLNAPCAVCGVFSKNHCEGGCLRGDKCCGRFQEKLKGPWCWLCNEYHATSEHTRTTGLRDPCAECGTLREHHCGGGECLYGKCCGRFEEASK